LEKFNFLSQKFNFDKTFKKLKKSQLGPIFIFYKSNSLLCKFFLKVDFFGQKNEDF